MYLDLESSGDEDEEEGEDDEDVARNKEKNTHPTTHEHKKGILKNVKHNLKVLFYCQGSVSASLVLMFSQHYFQGLRSGGGKGGGLRYPQYSF